jgi:large conductance mechanosensitive channel
VLVEFRDFVLRGNVVDLAVAVVVGGAFGAVVTAFVEDLLTPLIAAIGGQPDFGGLTFTINGSRFRYGDFLNAAVSFLTIAGVVFFVVVRPLDALEARRGRAAPEQPSVRPCPECLTEIPAAASRCSACTAEVAPAA